jgi:hypothetical protein
MKKYAERKERVMTNTENVTTAEELTELDIMINQQEDRGRRGRKGRRRGNREPIKGVKIHDAPAPPSIITTSTTVSIRDLINVPGVSTSGPLKSVENIILSKQTCPIRPSFSNKVETFEQQVDAAVSLNKVNYPVYTMKNAWFANVPMLQVASMVQPINGIGTVEMERLIAASITSGLAIKDEMESKRAACYTKRVEEITIMDINKIKGADIVLPDRLSIYERGKENIRAVENEKKLKKEAVIRVIKTVEVAPRRPLTSDPLQFLAVADMLGYK